MLPLTVKSTMKIVRCEEPGAPSMKRSRATKLRAVKDLTFPSAVLEQTVRKARMCDSDRSGGPGYGDVSNIGIGGGEIDCHEIAIGQIETSHLRSPCGGKRKDTGAVCYRRGANLSRQPIRCEELGARWGAASPAMRNREERGEGLAEDDEVNTDEGGQRGKGSHAVHELPGMRDLLAERAIRGVFVDRDLSRGMLGHIVGGLFPRATNYRLC